MKRTHEESDIRLVFTFEALCTICNQYVVLQIEQIRAEELSARAYLVEYVDADRYYTGLKNK